MVMRSRHELVDDRGLDPAPTLFVFEINGHLGATVLAAFPDLTSEHRGRHTVLFGDLDRAALYGVLAQMDALGLDLLEVCQVGPRRAAAGTCQPVP
jgi:hypothetical protein